MPELNLDGLPQGVQRLFKRFRERLRDTLQDNLVGIYFVGSIAFPGFVPDRVDLDFQVVVAHELDEEEIEALRDMHRLLVGEYRYAGLLKDTLGRLQTLFQDPSFNWYIHTAPNDGGDYPYYHWHLEITPRLSKRAGFERGSGFYINSVTPEDAARLLRQAGEA